MIRRYVHSLIPVFAGWAVEMILTVDISHTEEIPASTCIEGYGSFEVPDYTNCGCDESSGWDDEAVA